MRKGIPIEILPMGRCSYCGKWTCYKGPVGKPEFPNPYIDTLMELDWDWICLDCAEKLGREVYPAKDE